MKAPNCLKLGPARLATLALVSMLAAAPWAPAADPAGHWEGAISVPGVELGIRVDMEKTSENEWTGTIDIPVQGLRGFALDGVTMDKNKVRFRMPGVPGDPAFDGELFEDGQRIAGSFSQGGMTFPFKLARAEKKPEKGATPAKGIPGEGLAGFWQGTLATGPVQLRLVFRLDGGDDALAGTMDSVDQNTRGIAISKASADGNALRLELESIGGSFEGTLADDGSEIAGEWEQGGHTLPLTLKRLAGAPDFSRPQDPKRPYPYRDEEVVVENADAGIKLAGTLTIPNSAGPHPAVVLLTGSGPHDRDEATVGHRPFLVLADHLTRRGIAVLRCDDRGVGVSEGDFAPATNSDFVSDALASIAFLKSHPDIDPDRLGLIGHSEGGTTASRAAAESNDIAFVVLMAAVGMPMEDLLVRQAGDMMRAMGGDDHAIASNESVQREIFRIVRADLPKPETESKIRQAMENSLAHLTAGQREALGSIDAMISAQLAMTTSPRFRELLDLDPAPVLARLACPVLAVNGAKDLQVAAAPNLKAIEDALKSGGSDDVTVIEFPDLNHLFQTSQTGAVTEYAAIDETISPAALNTISTWLRSKAGLDPEPGPENQ